MGWKWNLPPAYELMSLRITVLHSFILVGFTQWKIKIPIDAYRLLLLLTHGTALIRESFLIRLKKGENARVWFDVGIGIFWMARSGFYVNKK